MNIPCNVILDLIPLVKDGVASSDSTMIVEEHIKGCENCKAEFEAFKTVNVEQPMLKDEKILFAIKRSIFITQLVVLIVGAIIGVAMTNSMGMFYNFIIMPVVGGISFVALKKKWYVAPISIFVFAYCWQVIAEIVFDGFNQYTLHSGLFPSTIYAILVVLGVIIAKLLKFAFEKER